MTDHKTASWISALEQARARLEMALNLDEEWRALHGAASGSRRLAHERALGANPVYRSWEQLNGAIEDLRASAARNEPARPQAEPKSERRRIELRHILEHIRSDATLGDGEPLPVASEPAQTTPSLAPQSCVALPSTPTGEGRDIAPSSSRIALPDSDEATVSFVIHDPTEAPADDRSSSRAPHHASLSDPKGTAQAEAADSTAEPEDDRGEEAQVIILSRPR